MFTHPSFALNPLGGKVAGDRIYAHILRNLVMHVFCMLTGVGLIPLTINFPMIEQLVAVLNGHYQIYKLSISSLYYRLQDYCERLMFFDPLEYGRRAEELLWRKVYYDIIQLMKHNRKVK